MAESSVFKDFLKKGEEIDARTPAQSADEAINLFLLKNKINERLFRSKSPAALQAILEESFLAANDMWHQ
jgi:hypothetical protein